MSELIEIKEEQERVILVAVDNGDDEASFSVDELEELADTAGALTVGRLIQKREAASSSLYIGKGNKSIQKSSQKSVSS